MAQTQNTPDAEVLKMREKLRKGKVGWELPDRPAPTPSETQRLGFYQGCGEQINLKDLAKFEADGNYVAEPKMDGIWGSAVSTKEFGEGFYSRTHKGKSMDMPSLPVGTILVGELGYGSEVSRQRKAEIGHDFMDVFDVVMLDGKFVNSLDMEERRARLEKFHAGLPPELKDYYLLVEQVSSNFVEFCARQDEGIVLKKRGEGTAFIFETKSPHWIKVKKVHHVDAVVMGYKISTSKTHGGYIEAFQLGVYKEGRLVEISSVGALKADLRRDGLNDWDKYKGRVMEVECYRIFESGKLRHPSMVRWRDDKAAEDCTWESLMKVKEAANG